MKIANKPFLSDFAKRHPDSISSINRWIEIVEHSDFSNHNELKNVFPTADYVGNSRYVLTSEEIDTD
ncbi:type II toxin-antitoxin system HigB family toxin [Niabella ginsengisoli]|uniref:Type II toxin-antitoxin system HigB family toxin n=1 Tax=Niabella ginsengisoli TaxID=522298 RepID=A0ABS9SLY2_9BACT|nr:type II toxin-antitoxin system HigB family toxin [Niabella ginsengisoli]MCH5599335.1 type II toxin-antitoxin system HigB family toxin [Niabella ginsengisoli]